MKIYLVNDLLTCIPGTKTFWHDLIEWFPEIEFKNGAYSSLVTKINKLKTPDLIIRNSAYFPRLAHNCRTISFVQDIFLNGRKRANQIDVCNSSTLVVFNSEYTKSKYPEIKTPSMIIPIGTDIDLFKPYKINKVYDAIYIGSSLSNPKGFDLIKKLFNTKLKIALVMKDTWNEIISNADIFHRINQKYVTELLNKSKLLICPSVIETQHLAGIEAMSCGVPVLATDVGIYFGVPDGIWGRKIKQNLNIISQIYAMLDDLSTFNPREYIINSNLSKEKCREQWEKIIYD